MRIRIGELEVGAGAPLLLIAGLNVIESEEGTLAMAARLRELAARHGFPFLFKASVDKANRSSMRSYRGPGFDEGLRILALVKRELGVRVTTDVHEPAQAKLAAQVVDCLQVPAFLSRQTDLLAACGATGLAVNVKKGQFLAPDDLRHAVEKVGAAGGSAFVTERGSSFGYNELVVDMRALVRMRAFAPVAFDATHAVQRPGGEGGASGGERAMVAPLARAAVAVGIDALFVEVHATPEQAPCDGPSQLDLGALEVLLREVRALDATRRSD
jgi:2-dehydro-3-deoxyphosphooctonate aldolase (KDO 8-P synthase)